jgi:hypothetical protein
MAPVLKRFDRTWPRVQVTLAVGMTADLLDRFNRGDLDLTLATERDVPLHAEEVLEDPLVWTGATGGVAHLRRPLPVSLGDASSSFHAPALAALTDAGIDWRLLSEVSSLDAVKASLLADIAVGPMLRCAVPDGLQVLGRSSGLPPLPNFHVNLHVHRSGSTPIVEEFARFIRQGLPRAAAAGGTMLSAGSSTRALPAGAAAGKRAGSQQRPKGQPG